MKIRILTAFTLYFLTAFACLAVNSSDTITLPTTELTQSSQLPNEIVLAFDSVPEDFRANLLKPLAQEIADRLNVRLKFYACPWARCLRAIEQGKADMIFSVFQTPERSKYMHFIEPEISQQKVTFYFWVNKDKPVVINTYQDLYPLMISTLRGNQYFPQFDLDKKLNKTEGVTYQSTMNLLLNKRVDAMIDLSLTPAEQWQSIDSNQSLVKAKYQQTETIKEFIGLSKNSDWSPHHALVAEALSDITAEGIITQLLNKQLNE